MGYPAIMRKIIITTSSVTTALKAKRLLESQSISARLIKLDSMKASTECTHGLEIDYKAFLDAVTVLKSKNISYRAINIDEK